MAYTSGTAANYKDLLAVLATFAAANGWSILEQSATQVYLKGEGLAGLDEIYCGISAFDFHRCCPNIWTPLEVPRHANCLSGYRRCWATSSPSWL